MAGLLRKFVKAWSEAPVEPYSIIIDDQPVIVNFRRNSRAKRIILRLTRDATGVVVTIPKNMNCVAGPGLCGEIGSVDFKASQTTSPEDCSGARFRYSAARHSP